MGILNLTPDSFSDGGKFNSPMQALSQAEKMLEEGATIIDVGGLSTRPNQPSGFISAEEELKRVYDLGKLLIEKFPEAIFSIDTFRSLVAQEMLEVGFHIVNDISGGTFEPEIIKVAQKYGAPYIVVHLKGTPETMHQEWQYENVVTEVWDELVHKIQFIQTFGINDIIIDLGFGFSKQFEHNIELLKNINRFQILPFPFLLGISRKRFIQAIAANETRSIEGVMSALHLHALQNGAKILRVHDVGSAKKIIELYLSLQPQ